MRSLVPFYQLTEELTLFFTSVFGLCGRPMRGMRPCRPDGLRRVIPGLAFFVVFLAPGPTARAETAALKSIDCSSSKLLPRDSVDCTVTLASDAPAEGVVVALTSNSGMVTVPPSVIVEGGKSMATFTASSSEVADVENATITAAAGDVQAAATLAQIATNTPLELVSKSSGKCLTEKGRGSGVDQTTCAGESSQKWLFKANGDGSYDLESYASNLALEGLGVARRPGEKIIAWTPSSTNSQKWRVQSAGTGYYSFTLEATKMCLGVASNANAAAAAQYTCSGARGQAWQVVGQAGRPAGHKVSLSWRASTSSGVDGYYVYRGTTSGGSLTRLSGKLSETSYVDASVQAGKTYYYATTAINSANRQSGYSNKVKATIP